MTEKALEARRAYKRKWARENRDKVREYQERHWAKVADALEAARTGSDQQRQAAPAEA